MPSGRCRLHGGLSSEEISEAWLELGRRVLSGAITPRNIAAATVRSRRHEISHYSRADIKAEPPGYTMQAVNYSIPDVIEAVEKSFHSIDIRVAATQEDGRWTAEALVIRLSYESVEGARERLRKLEASEEERVETGDFWIALAARPFAEWPELLSQLGGRAVTMNGRKIGLRQAVVLETRRFQALQPLWDIRPFDGNLWPGLGCSAGPHDQPMFHSDSLIREVFGRWHAHPYELVNRLCGINIGQTQGHGSQFLLSVPIFARVSHTEYHPEQQRVEATVIQHEALAADVDAVAMTRGALFNMAEPWSRKSRLASTGRQSGRDGLETVSLTALLETDARDDQIQIRLGHRRLGLIQENSDFIRNLIPITARNNLYQALQRFCPTAYLEQLLVRPHDVAAKKGFNYGRTFELRVAWLLALFGFSAIVLHDYEELFTDSRAQLSSADILASHPDIKGVFVIGCTTSSPDEKDFSKLLDVRGVLMNEVFAGRRVEVIPMLVTAAYGCDPYRQIDELQYLPILDASGIKRALEKLQSGRENEFLAFLMSPNLCAL